MSRISSSVSRKDGHPKLEEQVKMNIDSSLVLLADVPKRFFCVSCGNLLIPSYTSQTAFGDLLCGDCSPLFSDDLTLSNFAESNEGMSLKKEIDKVIVRCQSYENGCKWIGTLSDHATHTAHCSWGVPGFRQDKRATDRTISTKELAERYENAYFLWSWHGENIAGEPVLSDPRGSYRGMCAFVSIIGALEATLRLKGWKVKNLSVDVLYKVYTETMSEPNAIKGGKLKILATILKEKGISELAPDGGVLKKWYISKYEQFKMNTEAGLLGAIGHMRDHGPVICVHGVDKYQSNNLRSHGIIHHRRKDFIDDFGTNRNRFQTHAVCSVGFGAEDMTLFLHYQNTRGVNVQKDGYGRLLPCSVLEAFGLFVEECDRPVKRSKILD